MDPTGFSSSPLDFALEWDSARWWEDESLRANRQEKRKGRNGDK